MPDRLLVTSSATDNHLAIAASGALIIASPSIASVGAAIAVVALAHVARTDARTHRIPNAQLAVAAVVLALAAITSGSAAFTAMVIVSAVWGGLLLALHIFDSSLGFGDVKLGFVLGALLGLVGHAAAWTLPAVLLASSAAFVAGSLLTLRIRTAGATPFAPGLVLASVGAALIISLSDAIA